MKRPSAFRARLLSAAATTSVVAACLSPALGQSQEFKLSNEGSWVKTRDPEPGSDEATIARARVLLSKGEHYEARQILDAWIEKNEFTQSPWLPEAYLLRGDSKVARGREGKALRDYEEVIKNFPESDAFVKALEREFEIGKAYVNGLRSRFLGMRLENAESLGEEILIRTCERLPGSKLAEQSLLTLADYYYQKPDLRSAIESYRIFLTWGRAGKETSTATRPSTQNEQFAMQRLIYASVAKFKGPKYDTAPLEDALVLIDRFTAEFPSEAERTGLSDALPARIDESLAQQMLETGRWYLRRRDGVSARYTLERLIAKHPQTVAAARAAEIFAERGWQVPGIPTAAATRASALLAQPESAAKGSAANTPSAPDANSDQPIKAP